MRIVISVLLLAALAAFSFPPPMADAAQHPRVQAQNCRALASSIGARNVWQTRFQGQKRLLFDEIVSFRRTACFRTQAACKAWLYWAQSDWPRHNSFVPCRRGLR